MASSRNTANSGFALVYWPVVFAMGTMLTMLILDPSPPGMTPVTFDFSGKQAKHVLSSPWFFMIVLPMFVGLLWTHRFAHRERIGATEHRSMVWWLVNLFWFHTGCDLLSGFWQVMPVLTELYAQMTPVHNNPRWHESRAHLDAGYALELTVEVPMAAWVLWLFIQRDPARHVVEVFAASAQLAGTVAYYAPGLAKFESACWLSWADRSCGFIWILFPAYLLWGRIRAVREDNRRSGKTKIGKSS